MRTAVAEGCDEVSGRMMELAATQPGFLGVESARDSGVGITVSHWESLDAIAGWKRHAEHLDVGRYEAHGHAGSDGYYVVRVTYDSATPLE